MIEEPLDNGRGAIDPASGVRIVGRSLEYRDGAEDELLEAMQGATDRSTGSDELLSLIHNWPTRYHLSSLRANLLRPLGFRPGMRVLDAGAGTGVLSRYVAEQGAHVVALEGSLARARVAAARCAGLDNVEVRCGAVADLPATERFDVTLCVGVLEYAVGQAGDGRTDADQFLSQLRRHTDEGGALVLAIENQLGLKYLLGYPEDHLGRPWEGIEGYQGGAGVQTYSAAQLRRRLEQSGYPTQTWLYPYPDYKLPKVVLRHTAFEQDDVTDFIDQLVGVPVTDHHHERTLLCDDRAAHRSFLDAGLGPHVANSFLVLARGSDSEETLLTPEVAAWHFGHERLRPWRTEKRILIEANGRRVQVRPTGEPAQRMRDWLHQSYDEHPGFVTGVTLEQQALDACRRKDLDAVTVTLRRWNEALEPHVQASESPPVRSHPFLTDSSRHLLGGEFLDCNFDNFIEDAAGRVAFFDREWRASEPVDADLVRLRAVWYLASALITSGAVIPWQSTITVDELALMLWRLAVPTGALRPDYLTSLHAAEARLQALVTGRDIEAERRRLTQRGSTSRADLLTKSGLPLTRLRAEASRAADLEAKLAEARQAQAQLERTERETRTKERELADAQRRLRELTHSAGQLQRQARNLLQSRRWRIGRAVGDAFDAVIPGRTTSNEGERFARTVQQTAQLLDGSPAATAAGQRSRGGDAGQPYEMFADFLCYAAVHPLIPTPFTEADRRVLGVMDSRRRQLVARYRQRESNYLVSIIMPTFNRLPCLKTAIASVLEQEYRNWELLVVDDGSTDGTGPYVRGLDDARIRLLELGDNVGVAAARNAGLQAACGEVIAYLDSDNSWRPDYLLILAGVLGEQPDAGLAYCAQEIWHTRNENGCDSRELQSVRFGPFNRSLLENRNYIDLNCLVHRAELVDRYGDFDRRLQRLVDWELVLRYTAERGALAVPCVLSCYEFGVTEDQLTGTQPWRGPLEQVLQCAHGAQLPLELPEADAGEKPRVFPLAAPVSAGSDRAVTIVIPSFEALPYLRTCVDSVTQYTQGDYRLLIVDNGSSDEVVSYLRALDGDRAQVIFNNRNLGFTHAANAGIQHASADSDVILLNNDAVVTPGWIPAMWEVLDRIPDAGLVVPRQTLFPGSPTMQTHVPYGRVDRELDVSLSAHHHNVIDPMVCWERGYHELSFAPFFCVYLPRGTLDEVGVLNADNGPHYRSDRLYCDMVRQFAQRRIIYTPHAKLYHFLQRSTRQLKDADPAKYQALYVDNDLGATARASTAGGA